MFCRMWVLLGLCRGYIGIMESKMETRYHIDCTPHLPTARTSSETKTSSLIPSLLPSVWGASEDDIEALHYMVTYALHGNTLRGNFNLNAPTVELQHDCHRAVSS